MSAYVISMSYLGSMALNHVQPQEAPFPATTNGPGAPVDLPYRVIRIDEHQICLLLHRSQLCKSCTMSILAFVTRVVDLVNDVFVSPVSPNVLNSSPRVQTRARRGVKTAVNTH